MEQLGIDPMQILAQIFNFAVLVFVLNFLLYKPVLKALEDRRRKIQEGLEYSEKMKVEDEKSETKRGDILKKAREEAQKIIEEGKLQGRKAENEIIEKAQSEAAAILEKGKAQIDTERKDMERELRARTVEIAGSWVEAVLEKVLDTKSQATVIDRKLKELANLEK